MMKWPNKVSHTFKIKYPVIQAPMLGITTPAMVAAVSNSGGLGSLPVGGLAPTRTLELIEQTKALTDKPFAINLFVHSIPANVDEQEIDTMQSFLKELCDVDGIPLETQSAQSLKFNSYKDQVDVLISENIHIVSFTFGIPDDESIQKFKANGIILIGTATCVEEAELLEEKGIDMIVAQGSEAGGHRGSFLNIHNPPLIGSMVLIPAIAAATSKPVIGSGGITDGKSIAAAFMLGASAIQTGTIFLASPESLASEAWKKLVINAPEENIILTNAFSGRWARGLKNKLSEQIENSGRQIPAYPVQNSITASIRAQAQKLGNTDYIVMLRGQTTTPIEEEPAAKIFQKMVQQTEEVFKS